MLRQPGQQVPTIIDVHRLPVFILHVAHTLPSNSAHLRVLFQPEGEKLYICWLLHLTSDAEKGGSAGSSDVSAKNRRLIEAD